MKLLVFNDAHLRGSTPRSRTDKYPEALWHKFVQITQIIKDRQIQAVLNGGDLFDSPVPAQSLINEYLQLFLSWDIPIYSVIGSHDKFGYNNDTLPRTALGTLIAADAIQLIDESIWIGPNTNISGVSHSYDLDDNPKNYYRAKMDNSYMIQLAHGMLVDQPFFGQYTLLADVKTEADLVIGCHYHPGFGPIVHGKTTFINIGSLGRTERIVRLYEPGVLYINTDTPGKETWEYIPLQTTRPDETFIEKEDVQSHAADNFDDFMAVLRERAAQFEVGNIKDVILTLGKELGYQQTVIEKAIQYVE